MVYLASYWTVPLTVKARMPRLVESLSLNLDLPPDAPGNLFRSHAVDRVCFLETDRLANL